MTLKPKNVDRKSPHVIAEQLLGDIVEMSRNEVKDVAKVAKNQSSKGDGISTA